MARLQRFRRAVHARHLSVEVSQPSRALGPTVFPIRAAATENCRTNSSLRSASPSRISQVRPERWAAVSSSGVRPLQRKNTSVTGRYQPLTPDSNMLASVSAALTAGGRLRTDRYGGHRGDL